MAMEKKKILWVEDDKFLGSILLKKFASSDYDVSLAKNADEAFKMLEDLKPKVPNIIILDILLPGVGGFDILQKVKMEEATRHVPVIMLSNMNKPSDIEKAQKLGAQKFMVKAAVSLDEIVKEVAQLIK